MASTDRFVGRGAELAALEEAMDTALGGRARTVLMGGDPGIGKSRVADEFGRRAAARSVLVLSGRATREEGAPPFWPWRQAVRGWLAGADRETVRAVFHSSGEGAEDLVRIVPELRAAGVAATPPASSLVETEQRLSLLDRMGSFLESLAAANGLLIVLEDMHWADPASLLLLHHVAREVDAAPILLVCTYRPIDIHNTAESSVVGETLADISRLSPATRLDLSGLTDADVSEQLASVMGRDPDAETVATVMRRTGGNPVFVREIGRLLALRPEAIDGDDAVPEAVRRLIGQHLSVISADCQALLADASALGVDIDVRQVAAVTGRGIDDVLSRLDEARAAGIVTKVPGTSGYRFAHDLMRDCCELDNHPAERARLHLRAADYLAQRVDDHYVSEIAHHRFRALPLGDLGTAMEAGRRAAEMAVEQLAFEDAVRLYSSCVEAADLGGGDTRARAQLLVDRARARYLALDVAGGMADCEAASSIARQIDDPVVLARSALVLQDVSRPEWNAKIQDWCRRALAGLDDGDSSLRAQLLAQHAIARIEEIENPDMQSAGREALAMAERLDDPQAVRAALRAQQFAKSSPEGIADRLDLADRMARLSERTHDDDAATWAHL